MTTRSTPWWRSLLLVPGQGRALDNALAGCRELAERRRERDDVERFVRRALIGESSSVA